MSEYDKSQNFGVYDYNSATRAAGAGQDYAGFPPHQSYPGSYVASHSEVPSGLPQSAAAFNPNTPTQQYGPHDQSYYPQQHVQYPGYVQPPSTPRPLPEIISYTPTQGQVGTKVTVYFRSIYDFDSPAEPVSPVVMFGQKRCQSVLSKTTQPGQPFQYSLAADAPPLSPMSTPSPHVSLSLTFEDSALTWQAPSVQFGNFTYVDQSIYPINPNPQPTLKKRKLSQEASPRRSPSKKPSLQHISGGVNAFPTSTSSSFRKPSVPDAYSQTRRFSGPDFQPNYNPGLRSVQSQQFYGSAQTASSLQTSQSPSWNHLPHARSATRSPSVTATPAASKASLLPSPASNPPLIRTSTLQHSPSTPAPTTTTTTVTTQSFNPYTMYPANAKAMLRIDGDLNTMTKEWTEDETDAGRRLVQFRRSQQGSVITATFEPVSLEDRIPNSICVSCIYWAEKKECYVTSVDTISLLESLVAVRFTVEEKNRIRRNLEGFRPLTVSKTKVDSDDFFKLIMGFPNPKPRNIEKDVKVFPWRVLATALKKIIGKYSASYSSTAGALHTPRASDTSHDNQPPRPGASPLSTSSSLTSHGHAYAPNVSSTYPTHPVVSAGLGIGGAAGIAPLAGPPPDLRLTVPVSATSHATAAGWPQPPMHYSSDLSASARGGAAWELGGGYLNPSPATIGLPTATGLPHSAQSYQYAQQIPPLTGAPTMPSIARFVPLHGYEEQSQQTSNG